MLKDFISTLAFAQRSVDKVSLGTCILWREHINMPDLPSVLGHRSLLTLKNFALVSSS
jgi:hypothetical protein